MHFYGTCPSIICKHNIQKVTHTLGQVEAKILCTNLTPTSNQANQKPKKEKKKASKLSNLDSPLKL
jgi:hypothetical protein